MKKISIEERQRIQKEINYVKIKEKDEKVLKLITKLHATELNKYIKENKMSKLKLL